MIHSPRVNRGSAGLLHAPPPFLLGPVTRVYVDDSTSCREGVRQGCGDGLPFPAPPPIPHKGGTTKEERRPLMGGGLPGGGGGGRGAISATNGVESIGIHSPDLVGHEITPQPHGRGHASN